jgi:hypothetical protein
MCADTRSAMLCATRLPSLLLLPGAGDLDALASDELPVVADALASIEYRDPFLLTVLAGAAAAACVLAPASPTSLSVTHSHPLQPPPPRNTESVLERRHELSEGELLALLDSFSRMGNWFHDSHVLNQLTDELLQRAREGGAVELPALQRVAELLAGIHHPHKALQQHLAGAAGGGA